MTQENPNTEDIDAAEDTTKPSRVFSNSRASRLSNLAEGESMSEAVRIPLDQATHTKIRETAVKVKGVFSRAITTASERTGQTYKSESVQALAQSGDILIIQVVTRMS